MANAQYAVFGCGNKDWVKTYQRIPTLVDATFAERGAKRLVERGEGNAASAEFFEAFDAWELRLWEVLSKVCWTNDSALIELLSRRLAGI